MRMERATRYDLQLPLRYRRAGEPRWRLALTRNISSSGVLFDCKEILDFGLELDFLLAFSRERKVQLLGEVELAGRVVRVRSTLSPQAHAAVAAQFVRTYRFGPARNKRAKATAAFR